MKHSRNTRLFEDSKHKKRKRTWMSKKNKRRLTGKHDEQGRNEDTKNKEEAKILKEPQEDEV